MTEYELRLMWSINYVAELRFAILQEPFSTESEHYLTVTARVKDQRPKGGRTCGATVANTWNIIQSSQGKLMHFCGLTISSSCI